VEVFNASQEEDHMPWNETTRPHYERKNLVYASDCTDAEWEIIKKCLPEPSRRGRPRKTDMRAVWNAIQYIAATGCQWALLPRDFPPFTTVQYYFYKLRDGNFLDLANEALAMAVRRMEGREEMPTAGVIDSQSVKTTESGGPRGYDAGKKIKGRKRHILTDTLGNLLVAWVHTADIQDRDGALDLIVDAMARFPTLKHIFADGGYAGDKLACALDRIDGPALEIIKRSDQKKGFVLLPRRWVVERTFAWLGRCRRLGKDWETSIESSTAWLLIASIRRQTRFIVRQSKSMT
jgi:transposase